MTVATGCDNAGVAVRTRPRPTGAGRTAAIAIVVVVAGLAAVVLASRGVPSDRTRAAYSASFDDRVLLVGFAVIVVAMTALVIWSAWPDRGAQFQEAPRSWWRQYAVSLAVLLLLLMLGAARAELMARDRGSGSGAEGPAAGGASSDATGAGDWTGPASGTATVALGLTAVAVAAAVVGRRQARRRAEELARRRSTASEGGIDGETADLWASLEGLDHELDEDDIAAEPDPRRAVRLAYALLERRLAGTPAARPPAATPQEWLVVLRRAPAARTLTLLYERARFADDGRRPLTLADRDEAVRALRTLTEPSTSMGGRGL